MVRGVLNPPVGGAPHEIASHREKLNQKRNRVGFAVRLNRFDYLTRESLKGRFFHLRPCRCRCDRRDGSDRSCAGASWGVTLRRLPAVSLRVVKQCPNEDAIPFEWPRRLLLGL